MEEANDEDGYNMLHCLGWDEETDGPCFHNTILGGTHPLGGAADHGQGKGRHLKPP